MTHSTSITISNRSAGVTEVWIEPWGDCVTLPVDSALRIVAEAEQAGDFEVEYRAAAGVTIWAWPTSTVRCYLRGEEQKAGAFVLPVPSVPPGMSTSDFLRLVLGRRE